LNKEEQALLNTSAQAVRELMKSLDNMKLFE